MKNTHTRLIAALVIAGAITCIGSATAQVAGSTTTTGVTMTEASQVAFGWSVKKSILGKTVYNDAGEQIGKVQDLIIAPDKSASYLIIGSGGFVGLGRHDVAIPVSRIQTQKGRLVMPGASRDVVKSMPRFEYANDTARRDQLISRAEADIAGAKAQLATLQKNAAAAATDAKGKLDEQVTGLQLDLKSAEDKLAAIRRAGIKGWKEFESDLSAATARLRKSIETGTG